MTIKDKSKQLLTNHQELGKKLVKIPSLRNLTYREVMESGCLIAKPRFKPKYYKCPPGLLVLVRNHLQEIWDFFTQYSYWFDDRLKEILLQEQFALKCLTH